MRGLTFEFRYLMEGERMMGEGEQAGKSIYSHTNMLPDSQNIVCLGYPDIQIRNRQ